VALAIVPRRLLLRPSNDLLSLSFVFPRRTIARRRLTTLDAIQADAVEVIRREPYEYEFNAPCHMLIMSERQERDDGEDAA